MKRETIKVTLFGALFLCLGSYGGYRLGSSAAADGEDDTARTNSRRAPRITHGQGKESEHRKGRSWTKAECLEYVKKWRSGYSATDFEKEFRDLKAKGGDYYTIQALMMDEWMRQYPRQALTFFEKEKGKEKMWDIETAVRVCSIHHPELALEYYLSHRETCYDPHNAVEIIRHLADKDLDAAWGGLKKMSSSERMQAINTFLQKAIHTDMEKAKEYLAAVNVSKLHNRNKILEGLEEKDPEFCKKWISEIPNENKRKSVERERLAVLAGRDVVQFEKEFNLLPEKEKNLFLTEGHNLSWKMGEQAAVEFIAKADPSSAHDHEIEWILRSWQHADSEEFVSWMENLPDGRMKDLSRDAYAMYGPFLEYEKNVELVMQMKNKEKKESTLRMTLESWHDEFPEQADQWMAAQGWSEEEQDRVRKKKE